MTLTQLAVIEAKWRWSRERNPLARKFLDSRVLFHLRFSMKSLVRTEISCMRRSEITCRWMTEKSTFWKAHQHSFGHANREISRRTKFHTGFDLHSQSWVPSFTTQNLTNRKLFSPNFLSASKCGHKASSTFYCGWLYFNSNRSIFLNCLSLASITESI